MRKRIRFVHVACAAVVAALAVPAAGVTASAANEGQLKLVAWPGYVEAAWVKPFEKQSGCKVQSKIAQTSDEMVALMRSGGGGQYDMVSASGDASLRLIYGGDVAPVDMKRLVNVKDFFKAFVSPPNNTVDGKHYGVSVQFGPNVLLWNTKEEKKQTSWKAIYDAVNKGKITVPNNPIQIADAAFYLAKTQPALKITDPYELTKKQFDAAISLLKQQRPLVKKYWASATDQIDLFKNGGSTIGASWPYQYNQLIAAKVPVATVVPKEGSTGWLDTWMPSAKIAHPECAYAWMNYITSPKVQAQQAVSFGETPVNKKACAFMNKLQKGSCQLYSADKTEAYYKTIKFWKTPLADCGNGHKDCVPYTQWVTAWNSQVLG